MHRHVWNTFWPSYAVFLLAVALLLEMVASYVYQRSLRTSTVGFTYRFDSDTWKCPEDASLPGFL